MDPVAVLAYSVGLFFLASGLIAWYARPHNRVGPLMTLVGVLWFPQRFDELVDGLPRWGLMTISTLWASALAHLILAFPTGRLGSRRTRALAAATYLVSLWVAPEPRYAFGPAGPRWVPVRDGVPPPITDDTGASTHRVARRA